MPRNIVFIAVIIIVAVGIGLYFVLTLEPRVKPEEVLLVAPPVERYEFQGMEYEFISVGGPVYDIVTGQLSEEQVKILAEKIIGDIVAKNPALEEITLLFYSDLIAVGVGEVDVAEIIWTPEEIRVKIIE